MNMSRIKTVDLGAPPADHGRFGELRVQQKLNEYEFGVELWVMRDGVNRNKWDYRNIEQNYLSFVGQPILVAYVMGKVGDGHNMQTKRDARTGEEYQSFMDATAERIVGTLSEDAKDFSLVREGGHTWIVAKGRLFAFYAPELVEKIVRTGRMEVSAETMVEEEHKEGDADVYTKWKGIGVTILGEHVAPAIPGARIAKLAAMQDEFKTLKLRAASLNSTSKNPEKGVKRSMNKRAAEALAPKFEGYKIVALSEDGMNVGLIDAAGSAFTYAFNADDHGEVNMARLKPAHLTASFSFGANAAEEVEVSDLIDHACSCVQADNESAAELRRQLDEANEMIRTMEAAETARRLSAAKSAVKSTLDAFNANRERKIGEDAVKSIMESVEAGVYTNCCGKDGAWNGEQMVRDAVLAVCAAAVMEDDRKRAEARKTHFALDGLSSGDHSGNDGIGGLLDRWGVETVGAEK